MSQRCYDCLYYKPTSRFSGWCKDNREGRKSIRVDAVDFCDNFASKATEIVQDVDSGNVYAVSKDKIERLGAG